MSYIIFEYTSLCFMLTILTVIDVIGSAVLFSKDFVGRCCRISRRISPKTVGLRVLQRYLVMARKTWEKQSFDDKTQQTETEKPTKKEPNQLT